MKGSSFLCFVLLLNCCILTACSDSSKERNIQKQLTKAEMLMESIPDSSFNILQNLHSDVEGMPVPIRMEYNLLMANAQNRADKCFMPVDSFKPVVEFYEKEEPSQYLLALYLMGRIYHLEKDCPRAIEYYQKGVLFADSIALTPTDLTLARIHAQMADIYISKLIYNKAVEELDNARDAAISIKDTAMAHVFEELKVKPLSLSGRCKEVIALSEKYTEYYRSQGDETMAAICHEDALSSYIETGDLGKAEETIADYEKNSGLFDEHGRIRDGYEMFYYKKGRYLLKLHQAEAAAKEFRKLLCDKDNINNITAAYRGLLMVYNEKDKKDSIGKYSKLYCEMNDSLHQQQTAEQVASIESAYDYNRNKVIADRKTTENSVLRTFMAGIIGSVIILGVWVLWWIITRHKAHVEEKKRLLEEYNSKKHNLELLYNDSQRLAANYERDIKVLECQLRISKSNHDSIIYDVENGLIPELQSKAVIRPHHTPEISDKDWRLLEEYTEIRYPQFFVKILKCRLTDIEKRIMMLMITGFDDQEIKLLSDCHGNAFTNRKSRLNERLFGKRTASGLRHSVMQSLDTMKET